MLDVAAEATERLGARDGRRVVVLLDEFQEVERLGGTDLMKRLRAQFQRQPHVSYLFLGSRPSLMWALFTTSAAAFYRFAVPAELPTIPAEAWRAYLARKAALYGVTVSDAAVTVLLERTGGHPWSVMEVISEAWMARGDAQAITAEHVVVGFGRALARLTPVYEAEWAGARQARYADQVLLAVAADGTPATASVSHTARSRAVRHLLDAALIERVGRGSYRLVEPMFGAWLMGAEGRQP